MSTIHLLSVADVNDPQIGEGCDVDQKNFRLFLESVSQKSRMSLNVVGELKGSEFQLASIRKAVASVVPSDDDVVVFYYSGHGFRDAEKTSSWPAIFLGFGPTGGPDGLDIDAVYQSLRQSGPRMLMVIVDCCNNVAPAATIHDLKKRAINSPNTDLGLRKLFGQFSGTVLGMGCEPGETSLGDSNGGRFTNKLLSTILEQADTNGTGVGWAQVMSASSAPMTASLHDPNVGGIVEHIQEPVWEVCQAESSIDAGIARSTVTNPSEVCSIENPSLMEFSGHWRKGPLGTQHQDSAEFEQTTSKICDNCGQELLPQLKFCSGCGSLGSGRPLESAVGAEMNSCHNCDGELSAGQRYCGNCGASQIRKSVAQDPTAIVTRQPTPPKHTRLSRTRVGSATGNARDGGALPVKSSVLFVVPTKMSNGVDGLELRSILSHFIGRHAGQVICVTSTEALSEVQNKLRTSTFDAVCIIGTAKDIPHSEVRDLTGHDTAILTDNFFGMTSVPSEDERFHGAILPKTPVSRIPFRDLALIQRLLAVNDNLCDNWDTGVAVSAKVWQGASDLVLKTITGGVGPSLLLSPPTSEDDVEGALNENVGRLYFNVHGTDQAAMWVGDNGVGDYPAVLRPSAIEVADNAIVISEACYGAMLTDGEPAISETFLRQGAGAFVGSTIIAWGPAEPPISLADTIVTGTFSALDNGVPLALSLLQAKLEILNNHLDRDEALSPSTHNTLLSFVAYGSPLASTTNHSRPTSRRRFGATSRGIRKERTGGSVLAGIRGGMRGDSSSTLGVLDHYRQQLSRRLPPGTWEVLDQSRTLLAALSKRFRNYDEISGRLVTLLGVQPASVNLVDYRTGRFGRTAINGSVKTGDLMRHAILLVDEHGQILDSLVSR
jgi:hypothetical protein